jgi:YD repeat-containing protein
MVATVVGSRLGLEQTSAWVLGSRGQLGSSALGRGGENVFVNAATGNLVVTNRDEFLVGMGPDSVLSRSYNSLGDFAGDADNWRVAVRGVQDLNGALNTVGSYLWRRDWDGSLVIYRYDDNLDAYVSKEGSGAHDTLTLVADAAQGGGSAWRWQDGDTGLVEYYSVANNQIQRAVDRDGNAVIYTYNSNNTLSRATTHDGGYTDFVYDARGNLTHLTTTYWDPAASHIKLQTRTRYAYDGLDRLTSVTVDLSPEDNSVATGPTYVTTYTYDGTSKRVASISQTDGSRIDIQYETSGAYRVNSITQSVAEGVSRTTSYNYVIPGRTDVTSPDGLITGLEYNDRGLLTKIIAPGPTANDPARVTEFTYHNDSDDLYRETVAGVPSVYYFYEAGVAGLWTSRYEATGPGYLLTRRTYNAANALLTETRYQSQDYSGHDSALPPDPMTTRYVYDEKNHLRYVVAANGEVTRHDYDDTYGYLKSTTVFTGQKHTLAGLAAEAPLTKAEMDLWAAGQDKTQAQLTKYEADFRGNPWRVYAWSQVDANGVGVGDYTLTTFVYDQAGRVLSRTTNGVAGSQTFVYDGLGRLISAVDFDGGITRTAYYDRNAVTVETTADGLNKVAVYNRAGERVSYSESERGPNLIDMSGWPGYDLEAPSGPASLPYWPPHYNAETRWQVTTGPDGRPVVAMNAGQTRTGEGGAGGGSHTNDFNIDASKGYEFTYYFKKNDLSAHHLYFGLSVGEGTPPQAYVENATGGWVDNNPYFIGISSEQQQSLFQADRWYKVVGYVLPQGSANIAFDSMGGVFDVETGAKVAAVHNFRWSTTRPTNDVHSRFFDFYDEGQQGFSTQFYKPEVRRIDQPGTNLVRLEGWPGPAGAPNGQATVPGWPDGWATTETAWKIVDGPNGRQVVAMRAGQYDPDVEGGGAYTNEFTIDGSKDYQFVYYFRKDKLNDHSLFFGLSQSVPALVEYANGLPGVAETNPYFFGAHASSYAPNIVEDRWYKVVGHVLAEGSADVAYGGRGGVYDMETGQKVMDTYAFRWRSDRPTNQVHSRFFTHYDEGKTGFSTLFYQPEVYRADQPTVNLVNNAGWPAPPGLPNAPATVSGWANVAATQETRWQVTDGPEGRKIVAMQSGQLGVGGGGGGGDLTHEVQIDATKAYEFTIYLRKEDLAKHELYFGLSANWSDPSRPYVENAVNGAPDYNPYFYGSTPAVQQATLVENRWYKVVGYVLPQGTGNLAWAQAPGGVYDTVTGEKVAQTSVYRWSANRPGDAVHARFFTWGEEEKLGWSASFYKPEIRQISAPGVANLTPAESTQYRYDKMGRLRQTIDPTGRTAHRIYDNLGRLTGEIDGDGSLVEYKYDLEDQLIATVRYATRLTAADIRSLTDGAGNPVPTDVAWVRPAASTDDAWTWTIYDGAGRVLQTIDSEGGSTTYVHDGSSRLVSQTVYHNRIGASAIEGFKTTAPTTPVLPTLAPDGDRTTRYFYDAAGRQIGVLDAEGAFSRIVYDAGGRVVQTSAYATRVASGLRASGDFNSLLASAGSSADDIHEWSVYDGRGFLMGTVNGEGDVVLYTYNVQGHVVQRVTGKRLTPPPTTQPTLAQLVAAPAPSSLDQTAYDRNHLGQVTQEHRYTALGWETVTYTYDVMHRLVGTHTDRLPGQGTDYATRNRYDARGRLIGQLNGRGAEALAAQGSNPTQAQIDAVYRTWGVTFAYDAADRLISRTGPEGADGTGFTTFYFYDADGALAYEVNSVGEVKGYLYDALNRRTQAIAFSAPISITGLKGGAIVAGLPSRTALSGADSRTVTVYDTLDRVRYSEDANQRVTAYTYDAVGDLRGVHTPAGPVGGSGTRTVAYDYDLLGRLKRTSDGQSHVFETVFRDAFGRATQTVDARGVSRATTYDRAGRVKVVKDGLNNQTTYAYDPRGNVISVTDALGKTTAYSSDPHNRTQTVTTPEGLVVTTTYDDQGHVLGVTDGAGRTRTYAYDQDGNLVTETNSLGQTTTNVYDHAGRLYEAMDETGRKVRYGYDGADRVLTETVDPGGLNLTTTYAYDAKGQRIRVTDPSGQRTDYVFDNAGQTTGIIVDPEGLAIKTQFNYDRAGNVIGMWKAVGTSAQQGTGYEYDALGRLTYQQTGENGLGIRTAYDYDANGNVVRRRDGVTLTDNVATHYVYDAENRLILTVGPTGAVTRTEYDAEGRVVRTIDYATQVSFWEIALTETQIVTALGSSASRATDYVYDDDGRLVFTRDAVGQVTELFYDGSGNVVRRTAYARTYVTGTWPTEAELRGWVSVYGATLDRNSLAAYDAAGRQTYAIDAAGQVTRYGYDAAGRVIAETRYATLNTANGVASEAYWDSWAAGNALPAQDRVTRFAYDAAGRQSFVVDAEGYATRTTYREDGQVAIVRRFEPQLSVANGVSHATLVSLVADHEAAAATTRYTYDMAGRRYRTVDAEGVETQVVMDGLGRVTQVWEAYGTSDLRRINRTYDAGGRLIAEVIAPGEAEEITRSWTYDGLGRVLTEAPGNGYPTSYTYDAAGRVLTKTVPLSSSATAVTTNTYSAFGDLVKTVDPRGNVGFFYYDALGRQTLQVDPEGYATTTTYSRGGEVETVTRHALKTSGTPTAGTPPTVNASSADAVTIFGRDKLDRVTQVRDAEGYTETYVLNAFSDRVSVTNKVGGVTTYNYDRRGLMLNETLPVSSVRADGVVLATSVINTYAYDSRGNLTQTVEAFNVAADARTTTYAYDKLNRLIRKSGDAVVVTTSSDFVTSTVTPTEAIAYDRRGNVIRTVNAGGAQTLFYYDDADRKVAEIDAVGTFRTWTYDDNDNATSARVYDTPVSLSSPVGGPAPVGSGTYRETLYAYDRNNRLVSTTVEGLRTGQQTPAGYVSTVGSVVETRRYDAAGNVVSVTDGRGITTYSFYDKLGRQSAAIDGEGYLTAWTRDAEGNVLRETRYAERIGEASLYSATFNALIYAASYTDIALAFGSNQTSATYHYYNAGIQEGRSPRGFDAVAYLLYNDDLANLGFGPDGALLHWLDYGVNEGRSQYPFRTDETGPRWMPPSGTTGDLDVSWDQDWRRFFAGAGQTVTLDIEGVAGGALTIHAANGQIIATSTATGPNTARVTFTPAAAGAFYVAIRSTSNAVGAYAIHASGVAMPPANSALGDRITDFTYDRNGNRLTETRHDVKVYDIVATDKLTSANATITYAYNGLGDVTRKTEANGDYVDYGFDSLGRQTESVTSAFMDYGGTIVRRRTATAYNGLGQASLILEGAQGGANADARVTTFTYQKGRLASATDGNGFTRNFGYDAMGRVVQESYNRAQGGVAQTFVTEGRRYEYDALGRLTLESSASYSSGWSFGDGRATAYNAHGEVTAKGVNGLWQERFEYDKAGRLWRSTGGDGVTRFFVHDGAGRTTMTVASTGRDMTNWSVDDLIWSVTGGNVAVIGTYDLSGTALTFSTYDARGLMMGTRQPFAQLSGDATSGFVTTTVSTARAYNAFGEVTSETDARGYVTDFFYNTMGRLIETRRPEVAYTTDTGQVLSARPTEQYRYDVSGRLVATRTANGHWTERTLLAGSGHNGEEAVVIRTYTPDAGVFDNHVNVFGELVLVSNGLSGYVTNLYDKVGNLVERRQVARAAYTISGSPGTPAISVPAVQLIDHYIYDGLGQRISHWNNQLGNQVEELTEYDREGRVTRQEDFDERVTSYVYAWDVNLTTSGLGTLGGWIKTTTHASGKIGVERTDVFGRIVGKTDLGGRIYAMGYDLGGRRISQTSSAGQSLILTWFNTGLQAGQSDISGNAQTWSTSNAQATYGYDAAGNRVRERYATTEWTYAYDPNGGWDPYGGTYTPPTPVQTTTVRQDGWATYDALGRMTEFRDTVKSTSDPTLTQYAYDLNGNVRSTFTKYWTADGALSTIPGLTHWYKYDTMNRFVVSKGSLVGGQIVGGTQLEYDAGGNRRRLISTTMIDTDVVEYSGWDFDTNSGYMQVDWDGEGTPPPGYYWRDYYQKTSAPLIEYYDYTADGYLFQVRQSVGVWNTVTDTAVEGTPVVYSRDQRDAMGRLISHTEYANGGALVTNRRTMTYSGAGLIQSEVNITYTDYHGGTGRDYFTTNTTTYDYNAESYPGSGVWTGAWQGVVTRVRTTSTKDMYPGGEGSITNLPTSQTTYQYVWWDGAQQAKITHKPDVGAGTTNTSTFGYDVNGKLAFVNIKDGRPRNVTFVTDVNGQVLTRTEDDNNAGTDDPWDRYYYFSGVRIGEISRTPGYEPPTYVAEINNRVRPSLDSPSLGWNADFDQAYEALTPSSIRGSGQAWTVRAGDTLQGIAAAVWGDASLWYLIAEANGLTAGSLLAAGQLLTVPAKVGNVHNNADTFRPYDPNKALGDVNPTQPEPPRNPKKGGCGVIGQIIAVAIAVVVAYYTAGLVSGLLGTTFGTGALATTATAVVAGAAGGAVGSVASQGFLIATGAQDSFDWKAVALSAIAGGVGGGVKGLGVFSGSGMLNAAARSVVTNVVTQGVAVATGLQDKFSWTAVATAAVTGAVADKIGAKLSRAGASELDKAGVRAVAGAGAAIASAATRSLLDGSSFGDNVLAALPDVIGATIGDAITASIDSALVGAFGGPSGPSSEPPPISSDLGGAGNYFYDMNSGEQGFDFNRYFVQPEGRIVGGGAPSGRGREREANFLERQLRKAGSFIQRRVLDPISSGLRYASSGRAERDTRSYLSTQYQNIRDDVAQLEEVVVSGVRNFTRDVRQGYYAYRNGGPTGYQTPEQYVRNVAYLRVAEDTIHSGYKTLQTGYDSLPLMFGQDMSDQWTALDRQGAVPDFLPRPTRTVLPLRDGLNTVANNVARNGLVPEARRAAATATDSYMASFEGLSPEQVELKIQGDMHYAGATALTMFAPMKWLTGPGSATNLTRTGGAAFGGLERLGAADSIVLRQTGSGSILGSADAAYDAIRASTTDVGSIASNTGYKSSNIQKVKDHLFMNEQLLDRYESLGVPATRARFDSDIGIAEAWGRLESGTHGPADLQLLRHETAEAWYMRNVSPGYNAAHNAAQRRFPAPGF